MTEPLGSQPAEVEVDHQNLVDHVLAQNAGDFTDRIPTMSDRGSGYRFVRLFRDSVRYNVTTDEWLVRRGAHWKVDEGKLTVYALTAEVIRQLRDDADSFVENDTNMRDALTQFALRSENDGARWRMLAAAREHEEIRVRTDDLDSRLDDLATPNGIVDLKTGDFRTSGPDDICTRVTSVTYDPDATSPLLDLYLKTFVPDLEDQEILFGVLGQAIRGGNAIRVLPIFIGGTTSGKSQLMAALDRLLGGYICTVNVSIFRGNLDDKPRPDLVRAMHHRIAYSTEASKIWELHADQVKRLTGGTDPITYRNLHSHMEESVPRFTPIIVTNHMPRVKGADEAFKRRMITLAFDQTILPEKEDPNIRAAFIESDECLQALLARIVIGARDVRFKDGVKWSMLSSKYALAKMDAYGALDHAEEFITFLLEEEMLEKVPLETPASHCVKGRQLYELYDRWVKKQDKQTISEKLSEKDFNLSLRNRGWESTKSGGTRWLEFKLHESAMTWGAGL